jgi:hypothetical protein
VVVRSMSPELSELKLTPNTPPKAGIAAAK